MLIIQLFTQEESDWSANKPGMICPGSSSTDAIRFTFNNPIPESLLYLNVTFTVIDDNGRLTDRRVTLPWRHKSSTNSNGWLAVLPVNNTYHMNFDGMERVTNLSYTGVYWGLKVSLHHLCCAMMLQLACGVSHLG